ncbi:MAG TPA: glycyl-radical enzyme activating protein [Thermodesulfovibrionia bacterium]|nr:glycyl-radical enzyme activating protein [Thermodesulfovibrionia bacterium]
MSQYPLIVSIKRNSHEDGPGIRSVVFFKGCPLRCLFCHSPESQNPKAEITFQSRQCIKCGDCAKVCPEKAIDLNWPGRIHRDRCTLCGMCVQVCPGKGLRLVGTFYKIEELTEILLRDYPFYHHSGGGVTLSGGECTLYPNYLHTLLHTLKATKIHLALETSGYFDYATFRKKILPYLDLIYYDIKILNHKAHQQYTGRSNQRILDNFKRLVKEGVEVHARIPVVPGITATEENLSAIAGFLCKAGAKDVTLLPYNPLGFDMAEQLGRPKPDLPERFMTPSEEKAIENLVKTLLTTGSKLSLCYTS